MEAVTEIYSAGDQGRVTSAGHVRCEEERRSVPSRQLASPGVRVLTMVVVGLFKGEAAARRSLMGSWTVFRSAFPNVLVRSAPP